MTNIFHLQSKNAYDALSSKFPQQARQMMENLQGRAEEVRRCGGSLGAVGGCQGHGTWVPGSWDLGQRGLGRMFGAADDGEPAGLSGGGAAMRGVPGVTGRQGGPLFQGLSSGLPFTPHARAQAQLTSMTEQIQALPQEQVGSGFVGSRWWG